MVLLSTEDQSILDGARGPGARFAMELVVGVAHASGAPCLIDISQAHIDGCLYHGQAGVDFVRRLRDGGASVTVETTLNVSSLDLLHPELYRGSAEVADAARELMDIHLELGCRPTWTCAPYQLPTRPSLGEQIAWGESNAIVFANSVLGARTNRYGDFIDLACAITGRAPFTGLHTDAGRVPTVQINVDVPDELLDDDLFYPILGLWLGGAVRTEIPLLVGLDARSNEDRLKALGASAASSGAVALFHIDGLTPEAVESAGAAEWSGLPECRVSADDLVSVRHRIGAPAQLGAISVGTPHMSCRELTELVRMVEGRRARVPFYINTSRSVIKEVASTGLKVLEDFGATVVTDTCTYITPILNAVDGAVMTNSGKWAYYAPGNLGVDVVLGGLGDCVESAVSGSVVLNDRLLSK